MVIPSAIATAKSRTNKKQRCTHEENLISNADDPNEDATSLIGSQIVNLRLAKLSIAILLATIAGFISSETIQFVFHIASLSLSVISYCSSNSCIFSCYSIVYMGCLYYLETLVIKYKMINS